MTQYPFPVTRALRVKTHHGTARVFETPGNLRDAPGQFGVDEITDAAKTKTQGYEGCAEVRHPKERAPGAQGEPPDGPGNPQEPAVEGHAAVPNADQEGRILDELVWVVEEDIAESTTKHCPEGAVEDQIVDFLLPQRTGRSSTPAAIPPGKGKAKEIHQPIPAQGDRTEGEDLGADGGVAHEGAF